MTEAAEILNFPPKVSTLPASNEDSLDLTSRAYAKIVLHASKYPHAAVNGVLLAKLPSKGQKMGNQRLIFIDAIPLFHQSEGLCPMVEVALTQIEARAASVGMAIAGYYHASRHFKDTSIDVFSQRIADRVADLNPLGKAALLTLDNRRLSLNLQSHALIAQMFVPATSDNQAGKWKTIASKNVKVDQVSLAVTSALLQARGYKDLVDFDNHLDDVTQDYLNVGLNLEIDQSATEA